MPSLKDIFSKEPTKTWTDNGWVSNELGESLSAKWKDLSSKWSSHDYAPNDEFMKIYKELSSNANFGKLLSWHPVSIIAKHDLFIHSLAFSPDGHWLLTGSADHSSKLIDTQDWSKQIYICHHSDHVKSVAFHPNSRIYASTGDDGMIVAMQIGESFPIAHWQGSFSWINSLSFEYGGEYLLTGSSDETVRLWKLGQSACLREMKGHKSDVTSACFVPLVRGGLLALSGSDDETLRLWNWGEDRCLSVFEGHSGGVTCVSVTSDGSLGISGSRDKTIRVWELATGECLSILEGHTGIVMGVDIHPDNKRLASCSMDGTIRIWDIEKRNCLAILKGHEEGVWTVRFHPDGFHLISGSEDKTARLWQIIWELVF